MRLQTFVIGALSALHLAYAGGILAIDYGTEWMKVSLVKPGVPFDVLLNTDSKRKIQSVVALKGEDRWIGGDAANLASRFPDSVYPSVKLLLGHSDKDAQSQIYSEIYRTPLQVDAATQQVVYTSSEAAAGTLRYPEEALAMQLSHAKKLAKAAAGGESIIDVVVIVPAFFNQAERQAVLDGIELAGLKSLALLEDGSAVAINYAMTRNFPNGKAENHLFYDAGAGSIRSTIVSFQTLEVKDAPSSKTSRTVTSAEVKGIGYDRTIGGVAMDSKIRDMLEKQFNEKEGSRLSSPLADNRRAQAKLMKEAARVKQVLSANPEAPSRIEGLADDIDFKGSVSREAFEAALADYRQAFEQPIHDALKAANLTVAELDSVILVGGTSRVPMVRAAVTSVVGDDKIAQNLNADEAAVMGGALYGAGLSKQFKTKDIRLTGLGSHAIEMSYETQGKDGASAPRILTSTLFPAQSKYGVQKTLTFKKNQDFPVSFSYKSALAEQPTGLAMAHISGLTEAYANLTEVERVNATVQMTVGLDDSGLLSISAARLAYTESKEGASVKDRLKGLFGGKDKDKKEGDAVDSEEKDSEGTDEKAAEAASARPSGPIKLKVELVPSVQKPLSSTEKKNAIKRLRDVDQAEVRKQNREEARNGLEAYIYRLRDTLEQADFVEASTESERVSMRKKLEEAGEWLWDEGETAPTKDLKSAKLELERAASGPTTRISEAAGRIAAATELRVGMITAQAFLVGATKQLENDTAAGEPSKYTETELTTLEAAVAGHEKWLNDAMKRQDILRKNEDPAVRISEIARRKKELASQLSVLQAKRPPRKPKKSAAASATVESSTASPSVTTIPVESASGRPLSSASSEPRPTTTIPAHHARDEL